MKDDRITIPGQLQEDTRYRVRYRLSTDKTKSGEAIGLFTDVLVRCDEYSDPITLYFRQQPEVKWLDVVSIEKL